MALEEREHPPPRIGRRIRVLVVSLVEERVRGAWVDVELVLELRFGQASIELFDLSTTWGMYSNCSPRGPKPAVRPK